MAILNAKTMSIFLTFNILFAMVVARSVRPTKEEEEEGDKKQPEWLFIEPDGSVFIPGIGKVWLPKPHGGPVSSASFPVAPNEPPMGAPTPSASFPVVPNEPEPPTGAPVPFASVP